MKQYCGEYSLNLNEPMGGTTGHVEHFFFMTWPKTKWGRKAFQDSDRASTSHYSEVERYSGGNTRRNFNQVNSASRPIELEGLKICAYPEGILYDNIPTKEVFEIWKIN